jgi:hypothetical protein
MAEENENDCNEPDDFINSGFWLKWLFDWR